MSEAHIQSTGTTSLPPIDRNSQQSGTSPGQPSFAENFLNSFFQEKNIKWMLIVGAAIVFGSSLMLVTKNWPRWPNTLKYFTILGYTAVVFAAAEVSRVRLGLQSTYKVLHSLTLLLLPVCFLALRWLTSGTATQSWDLVEFVGLLLPATGFLWFASSRILDHLLRGRQSTFLISYCVLSVAGALPPATTAVGGFAFMAVCWLIMTAGVLKVNRHTFWLAEEHQLPRIFGFLPIAMLGLQFAILAGTKAVTAIPLQWTGFGLVMVAATVLLTTRTVADVYRKRTGDLVRPLPWNIVAPLFCGLVLTALGLTLSFNGFSYIHETTYAVIPTAIIAAGLMFLAAKDTRHAGFVWAGLICATIGYQCCPVLFADIVNALKQTTAEAIKRERVPFSLYGITYLPLLTVLAGVGHWFLRKGDHEFSRPIKHFVTALASILFCVAMTDQLSRFFVPMANIGVFMCYAIAFRDRRYVLPSIVALVIATGFAIPALNDMEYSINTQWTPTVLATLAVLMTATQLPDRILNTIPLNESIIRHRDGETNRLTQRSLLLQTADGRNRNLVQLIGCVLAAITSAHWIGHALMHFPEMFSDAAMVQFGLLMTAFAVYTIRNPHYLSGFAFWSLLAYAGVHFGVALEPRDPKVLLNIASYATAAASILSFLWLKITAQINRTTSLQDLRRQLGLKDSSTKELRNSPERQRSVSERPFVSADGPPATAAFLVPLCDLSLGLLTCVVAPIHLLLLAAIHVQLLLYPTWTAGSLMLSTAVTIAWLVVAVIVFRSRIPAIAASIALPLTATAAIGSAGFPITAAWCPVVWAAVEGLLYVFSSRRKQRNPNSVLAPTMSRVSEIWLQGLLLLSCASFSMPFRIAAMLCLGSFLIIEGKRLNPSRLTYFAIMGNIQVLLLAAGLGGCGGFVLSVLAHMGTAASVPLVFLVAAASVLFFDAFATDNRRVSTADLRFDSAVCLGWTAILRTVMVILAAVSITLPHIGGGLIAIMALGFVLTAVAEIRQAIRKQTETHVWAACVVAAMATFFLFDQGVIILGAGISQFVLLGISITGLILAHLAKSREQLSIRRPMHLIGQTLPAMVAMMAVTRELVDSLPSVSAFNALALMLAAGIYFQQAMVTRQRKFAAFAAIIMNAGLMLLWRSLDWHELEFYLVPVGLSVLGFVELLKAELPRKSHDPLRYIGALTILVSPLFDVLGGSWGHMFTLMVLSVMVILAAIGLRIKVLVYTGSAFLLADLVAMVIRSTVDHPSLLWVGGVGLGVAVIALAAFCENHREKLLTRIRFLSAELATWN